MEELTVTFVEGSPLYEQLYRWVAGQIRTGKLPAGEKLPSKRRLAQHLGVSLTTVERAYELLTGEGDLDSKPRSGYRVASILTLPTGEGGSVFSLPEREEEGGKGECFSTSAVDTSLFPYATWARLNKEAVYGNRELLQRGDGQGDWAFRAALAEFLHQYRGVDCTPEQVVVGAGLEGVMWVLLQLLPGAVFALEDPGYAAFRRLLDNLGRPYVPVPVDRWGMSVRALAETGADVAYVTPSHQFPMGVAMPVGRRSEMLRWAGEREGRYIIEDDYDSEFRYATRPIPAMQGLDGGRRVIYMGTFSRTVGPSIRVAYLILPPALAREHRLKFRHAAATVSRFEQEALRRFLASGAYGRHLRRVGGLYRRRRAALAAALEGWGEVSGEAAGLHLLFTLPGREEEDLVCRAAGAGYRVRGLGEYCLLEQPKPGTLVLGFGGLPEAAASGAAEELRQALQAP